MKTFKNVMILLLGVLIGSVMTAIGIDYMIKEEIKKYEQDEFVEYLYDMGYEEVEYEGRQEGDYGNHMYGIVHYEGRIYQIDYTDIDDTKDELNETWNFIKRN